MLSYLLLALVSVTSVWGQEEDAASNYELSVGSYSGTDSGDPAVSSAYFSSTFTDNGDTISVITSLGAKSFSMASITTSTKKSTYYNGWWIAMGYSSEMTEGEPMLMCILKYNSKVATAASSTECSLYKFKADPKSAGVEELDGGIDIEVTGATVVYNTVDGTKYVDFDVILEYKFTEEADLKEIRKNHFGNNVPVIMAYGQRRYKGTIYGHAENLNREAFKAKFTGATFLNMVSALSGLCILAAGLFL
jgi:hypothetical protein